MTFFPVKDYAVALNFVILIHLFRGNLHTRAGHLWYLSNKLNGIEIQMQKTKKNSELQEETEPFSVTPKEFIQTPFVFSSPHSGRNYPHSFVENSRLNAHTLRKSEDFWVDNLFDHVCEEGTPFLRANFPRAYIDVNREPYELDPELFDETLPNFANTKSVRVVGGLGTIPRIVSETDEIYPHNLTIKEALERINNFYRPYHHTLKNLMDQAFETFGVAILIDCHSMPSSSHENRRPDFVLGDRFGTSCSSLITSFVEHALTELDYKVQRNKPYAGGYITEHYGQPSKGHQALQVEINRSLYMDEKNYKPNGGFHDLRKNLKLLSKMMFDEIPNLLGIHREAAE